LFCIAYNIKAQVTSNLYLKDGTNFKIQKAFDLDNDSISFQLTNKSCIRISFTDLYKIILCENYARIPDTVQTVTLVTGIKYAATYAVNFNNGTVNLKLSNGEIKNVPIEMISTLHPIESNHFTKEYNKQGFSIGSNALFLAPFNKPAAGFELSAYQRLNNLVDLNLYAGIYLTKINSSAFPELEHLENQNNIPSTKHQYRYGKTLFFDDYDKIVRTGNLCKNMYYVGAKAHFYLFGYDIKNYLGLGLNYYLGVGKTSLHTETKSLEFNRMISVYDSLTNTEDIWQEPVIAKTIQTSTFTRKPFTVFNLSYKIKYWLNDKCYLTNEIGFLYGNMKINVDYNQDTYYTYTQGNYYQDETSSNSNYSYKTKVSFNQFYCSVGLYYNR
jgi:hypothetical protein